MGRGSSSLRSGNCSREPLRKSHECHLCRNLQLSSRPEHRGFLRCVAERSPHSVAVTTHSPGQKNAGISPLPLRRASLAQGPVEMTLVNVQIRTGHIPKLLKKRKLGQFPGMRLGVSIPHKLIRSEQKKVQTDEKKPLVTDICVTGRSSLGSSGAKRVGSHFRNIHLLACGPLPRACTLPLMQNS